MKKFEDIFKILNSQFPKSNIEPHIDVNFEPFILIPSNEIFNICKFLKECKDLFFDSLINLSVVDDFNGNKIKDSLGNEIIEGGTISIYYHLESLKFNHKILLKVMLDRDNPSVESVSSIWNSANWHEREGFDLFGVNFVNHPDLRRILMPYDWQWGYPLRKDYKNPEFYQGIKVPY